MTNEKDDKVRVFTSTPREVARRNAEQQRQRAAHKRKLEAILATVLVWLLIVILLLSNILFVAVGFVVLSWGITQVANGHTDIVSIGAIVVGGFILLFTLFSDGPPIRAKREK